MTESGRRDHWNGVFDSRDQHSLTWYRPHLEVSLGHVERVAPNRDAAIVDVGCGTSTLVDDLLELGYRDLTVVDISESALAALRTRLGAVEGGAGVEVDRPSSPGTSPRPHVEVLQGDVTRIELPAGRYDVWHDRAVFHFLIEAEDRARYLRGLSRSVRSPGHVSISTFGPDGPIRCSGLEVCRYDASRLSDELGPAFTLLDATTADHVAPSGNRQQFLHALFRYAE